MSGDNPNPNPDRKHLMDGMSSKPMSSMRESATGRAGAARRERQSDPAASNLKSEILNLEDPALPAPHWHPEIQRFRDNDAARINLAVVNFRDSEMISPAAANSPVRPDSRLSAGHAGRF